MDARILRALNVERRARRGAVVITDLDGSNDRLIRQGDPLDGELALLVATAFRTGKSRMAEVEGRNFFLNAHLPHPRLVVIGAVHISQVLAPMARIVGYPVEIIDPRSAFATPERFPDITLHAKWPEDALKAQPLDSYTALAALTHDPKVDDFPLKAALDAKCFYVGALGSRKTHAKRVERLLAMGTNTEQIERIHSPIGIDIGAASPAEIAIAVLAEVVHAFRSRGLETQEAVA